MKAKTVLLLTACVDPGDMRNTVVTAPDVRLRQYVEALRFYLENTTLPVVVCENTLTDFSDDFTDYIEKGRLEYLSFDGNKYNKALGKGYGEAKIIEYALEHSSFISPDTYVVKITGRIIFRNIVSILPKKTPCRSNILRCYLNSTRSFYTVIFMFHPSYFLPFLKKHFPEELERHDDDIVLEDIMARAFSKDKNVDIHPFLTSPMVDGVSATFGHTYQSRIHPYFITDNLQVWSRLLKDRDDFGRASLVHLRYRLALFITKATRIWRYS